MNTISNTNAPSRTAFDPASAPNRDIEARPRPRLPSSASPLPATVAKNAGSLGATGGALSRAARQLFTPSAACTNAGRAATAQLAADWKALEPKLTELTKHLEAARPALSRVGVDAYNLIKGAADITMGINNMELAGAELFGSEGALSPVAALQATHALMQMGNGLSEVAEGASRLPADWPQLKPHLEQLVKDVHAMKPELRKLRDDAQAALGTLRQECLRM